MRGLWRTEVIVIAVQCRVRKEKKKTIKGRASETADVHLGIRMDVNLRNVLTQKVRGKRNVTVSSHVLWMIAEEWLVCVCVCDILIWVMLAEAL